MGGRAGSPVGGFHGSTMSSRIGSFQSLLNNAVLVLACSYFMSPGGCNRGTEIPGVFPRSIMVQYDPRSIWFNFTNMVKSKREAHLVDFLIANFAKKPPADRPPLPQARLGSPDRT